MQHNALCVEAGLSQNGGNQRKAIGKQKLSSGFPRSLHWSQSAHLTDSHVGPGSHVVGLQVQGALVGCDGLPTLTGVGQRRTQLVPEGIVLGLDLQGCSKGRHGPVIVPGQVV